MIEHGKTTNLRADLLEAKTRIVDLSQLVREQQREITALKKRLLDSQARTKELYLALRKVVTKDHPAIRRKK